jgi:Universal stress protein family
MNKSNEALSEVIRDQANRKNPLLGRVARILNLGLDLHYRQVSRRQCHAMAAVHYDQLIRRNAQNDLDALWSEIKEEYPRTDAHHRCGVPAEEIVAAAKDLDMDLIVISTHNYNWLTHLIRGSDAEQVLRHAPCPIMVVRKHEHDFVTTTTGASNRAGGDSVGPLCARRTKED